MNYRKLGTTDLKVSTICLGTMTWGEQNTQEEGFEQMDYALDQGVNFWDTAELYAVPPKKETFGHTEIIMGNWFQKTKKRDKVILATKVAGPSREYLRGGGYNYGIDKMSEAINDSLKRLQTDYIDLYQLHTPDKLTPIDETIKTLDQFIRSGKIRYIGCSNYSAWQVSQLVEIQRYLGINNFVSVQPEYNILRRSIEKELIPCCKEYGLGILAYHPLDSGFLTGKYSDTGELPIGSRFHNVPQLIDQHFTNKRFQILENLQNFVRENKRSLIELAIAWLLSRPMVGSVIVGSSRKGQIRACVEGVNWVLDNTQLSKIEKLLV